MNEKQAKSVRMFAKPSWRDRQYQKKSAPRLKEGKPTLRMNAKGEPEVYTPACRVYTVSLHPECGRKAYQDMKRFERTGVMRA